MHPSAAIIPRNHQAKAKISGPSSAPVTSHARHDKVSPYHPSRPPIPNGLYPPNISFSVRTSCLLFGVRCTLQPLPTTHTHRNSRPALHFSPVLSASLSQTPHATVAKKGYPWYYHVLVVGWPFLRCASWVGKKRSPRYPLRYILYCGNMCTGILFSPQHVTLSHLLLSLSLPLPPLFIILIHW